jgi:hypothetical protein
MEMNSGMVSVAHFALVDQLGPRRESARRRRVRAVAVVIPATDLRRSGLARPDGRRGGGEAGRRRSGGLRRLVVVASGSAAPAATPAALLAASISSPSYSLASAAAGR